MRKVEVVAHNPKWRILFQMESEALKKVFEEEVIEIYHIGSTAIPTIQAKPIIDVMMEVKSIEKVDIYNGAMESLGYVCKGEYGIPDRRFFQKGGDQRTHHVHVFESGSPQLERHLVFRNYLITHPEEAQAYSELKGILGKKFPNDIASYVSGKHHFIQDIDRKAERWMRLKPSDQ